MKYLIPLIALGLAACGEPAVKLPALRQCTTPVSISCEDLPGLRRLKCTKHVANAVAEINAAANREILQFVEYDGTIPVVFVEKLKSSDPSMTRLGQARYWPAPDGCMYAVTIELSALMLGYDSEMQTVILHEVLHAVGMQHTGDGVMTPSINDPQHTAHMSVNDIHRLKAVYGE